jgi:hypothetical protein
MVSQMSERQSDFPWYVFVIGIAGGVLMLLGGAIALVNPAMLAKGEVINGAVRVYAGYLVSRNIAVGAMLLGALFLRARSALSTLMLLAGAIQILDAVIDCADGRWMIAPGVAVLGIAFLFAARKLGSIRVPARGSD